MALGWLSEGDKNIPSFLIPLSSLLFAFLFPCFVNLFLNLLFIFLLLLSSLPFLFLFYFCLLYFPVFLYLSFEAYVFSSFSVSHLYSNLLHFLLFFSSLLYICSIILSFIPPIFASIFSSVKVFQLFPPLNFSPFFSCIYFSF